MLQPNYFGLGRVSQVGGAAHGGLQRLLREAGAAQLGVVDGPALGQNGRLALDQAVESRKKIRSVGQQPVQQHQRNGRRHTDAKRRIARSGAAQQRPSINLTTVSWPLLLAKVRRPDIRSSTRAMMKTTSVRQHIWLAVMVQPWPRGLISQSENL